jgi:DNA-binding beta-propeller fold protein YncE
MSRLCSATLLVCAAFVLAGTIGRTPHEPIATGRIVAATWPYLPGSIIPLRVSGFAPPYQAVLLGPGRILAGGLYEIPRGTAAGSALIVAGNAAGLAQTRFRIAPPPPTDRDLLVVASYDDGIVFHDARNFSVLGVLATGGTPSDAAVDPFGRIAVTDTQGTALTLATLSPWSVAHIEGVVLGDEIAIDRTRDSIFVTDRDWNGSGALTRVTPDGSVTRVATGATAEGLTIDERRQIVYVANANDGTVAAVNAASMRVVRRFNAVSRIFSLALSPDGTRLYGISNQSAGSPFAAPGSAVALTLQGRVPRVVARSANLDFPIGVALDSTTQTLFVTDEGLGVVNVLDARTLRAKHPPLRTCSTPWKPALDPATERLYVPCAGANAVDAFDARTLRRIPRTPFQTGSYPLAVGIWHPK